MSGQKRVVKVALLSYRNADGLHQIAVMGQVVELEGAELERAERLGAVGAESDEVAVSVGPVSQPAPPVDPAEAGKLLDEPAAKPARVTKARES